MKTPKKQGAKKDYLVGDKKPPKANQFGQPNGNPRHSGAWKKEDTPRFKIQQMMTMRREELESVYADNNAPAFERKIAMCMINGEWKTLKEMMHEIYGTPKQSVDITSAGNEIIAMPMLVDFGGLKSSGDIKKAK
jgi:hypothetical protein